MQMVNWASALAGGVGIAATQFNKERREDMLIAQEMQNRKDMQDDQQASAYSIALLGANARVRAAGITSRTPPKGSRRINVPDFTLADETFSNRSFDLTSGTGTDRNVELKEKLNVALEPYFSFWKTIGQTDETGLNIGMAQSQFDKAWEQVADPVRAQINTLWNANVLPQLEKGNNPPTAFDLLGPIGKIPQVKTMVAELSESRLTQPQRKRAERFRTVRPTITAGGENVSPTLAASIGGRYTSGSREYQSEAQELFNPEFFIAAKSYINTGDERAFIDAARKKLNPNVTYTNKQVMRIAEETTFLSQPFKNPSLSSSGVTNINNKSFDAYDPSDFIKTAEAENNLSTSLENLARSVYAGADVTTAGEVRSGFSNFVGTIVETGQMFGQQFGLFGDDETLDVSISNRRDLELTNTVVSDFQSQLNALGMGDEHADTRTRIKNAIKGIKKSQAELQRKLEFGSGGELNKEALATYTFHMEKLSVAYLYSKYLQGGSGGNAVSNADFKNTMDALFGVYDPNPKKQAKLVANTVMGLHSRIQKNIQERETRARYTLNMNDDAGKPTTYKAFSPFIKKVQERREEERKNLLFGRGKYASMKVSERTDLYWTPVLGPDVIGRSDDPAGAAAAAKKRKSDEFNAGGVVAQ